MPSRMRDPEEKRIELHDDDWVLVKKHLTAGDLKEQQAHMIKALIAGDPRVELDPEQVGVAEVIAYLLDWSILDARGNPVVIRQKPYDFVRSALMQLDPEKFTEIRLAIDAHDQHMRAEREAEKNAPAGATASSAFSESPA